MHSYQVLVFLLSVFTHTTTCTFDLLPRAGCSPSYTQCAPKGAATSQEPAIGTGLATFYVDVVDSIQNTKKKTRDLGAVWEVLRIRAPSGSLCCAEGTKCLLLQDYNLPFCYDNYTTNYFLPGGSYGQITSGNYTAPDGSIANLISGNFTSKDGNTDNVYGAGSASKPDLSMLPLPTQYTASGSGGPIPVTALGQEYTYTTTIPGTTVPPSTIPAETLTPSVLSGSISFSATTEPASVIPGTTKMAETETITTRVAGTATSKPSTASARFSVKGYYGGPVLTAIVLSIFTIS